MLSQSDINDFDINVYKFFAKLSKQFAWYWLIAY